MIDLRNQIIDSLRGIVTTLVHLSDLIGERPDAGITPVQFRGQRSVLSLEELILLHQAPHQTIEPLEVSLFLRIRFGVRDG